MLTLITGGSGSGKSEFAENLAVAMGKKPLYYIATMIPFDEESKKKIARHQSMREKKDFTTIECFTNLLDVSVQDKSIVLLECMSNLLANELYREDNSKESCVGNIIEGIKHLLSQSEQVIVVSNEVFSDGLTYDDETNYYIKCLGEINTILAQIAEEVIEVVYTIPIYHKVNS